MALIAASPALAQQTAPSAAAAAPTQGETIQEVVVTAQRREERLQSVPIAVSALSASTAINAGVIDTTSLTSAVPGLSFTQQASGATPFLRGVGSSFANAGAEPSVATYVDGVYISSVEGSLFNFNNIQRVEVLKGPQGTLFGRNATGGVVQVVTKDPSFQPSADMSIGYANYDTSSGSFYGTMGLLPNLAADLAVVADNQAAGWGHNLDTGRATYTSRNLAVRNKWIWRPREGTQIKLSLDYSTARNESGIGLKPLAGTEGFGGYGYPGFFNTNANGDDHAVTRQRGGSLDVTQDLGFASLHSITAYRRTTSYFFLDQDATPLPIVNAYINDPDEDTTEELQLISPRDTKIQWILGFFYFHDQAGYSPLMLGGFAAAPLPQVDIYAFQRTSSYAGYGQTTIEVLPQTHFTAGLRYTDDQRSIDGQTNSPGIGVLASGAQSKDFDKITWRFSLDHQFTSDILAYLSYNRGFKSGLFNTITYSQPAVQPEVLDAYEVGLKSEYLDHRLRANLAGYYYDYSNLQVSQIESGATVVVNAAKAEIYGLDADFTAIPVRNLTLTLNMAYIHGRYTSFPGAPYFPPAPGGGSLTSFINASGLDTTQSPPFTMDFRVDYKKPTSIGDFDILGDYSYNDGFYWDPADQVSQPSYSLINASLGWTNPGNHYGVRLFAKNLANARYYSYATSEALGAQFAPAAPLSYGVVLSAHF